MGDPLFLAWSVRHARTIELADELGIAPVFVGVRTRRRRWATPFRYIGATLATMWLLLRRRPTSVLVMAPPLLATIIAVTYGRVRRVPVGIDAHTGAVLRYGSGATRLEFTRLARFARFVIVTNEPLANIVREAGGRPIVMNDALPAHGANNQLRGEFHVVAPLSWAPDEPIEQIIEAARRSPDTTFRLTGRPPRTVQIRTDLPTNVELCGFLDDAAFRDLLLGAGVVLALTTREATLQQAGYEAMAIGCPVIASDTVVLREFFGAAGLYAGTADELAAAVERCRTDRDRLASAMVQRAIVQRGEFAEALVEVRRLLDLAITS